MTPEQIIVATLANHLRHRREALGWSRQRLAREADEPHQAIVSLERGDNVRLYRFARIAAVLGIEIRSKE